MKYPLYGYSSVAGPIDFIVCFSCKISNLSKKVKKQHKKIRPGGHCAKAALFSGMRFIKQEIT